MNYSDLQDHESNQGERNFLPGFRYPVTQRNLHNCLSVINIGVKFFLQAAGFDTPKSVM